MATQEELLRSQQIGQRIRDIFGPLPGSGKGLDRLAGIPYGLLAQIYGGAADITGGIGSTFGLDEFAVDQYNRADDAYKAAMDKYTKGFGGSGGFKTILKPAPYSPDIPENPLQQIQTQSLPPSLSSFNTSNVQIMPPSMTGRSPLPLSSHTTSKYGFEKIKSPQDLLTTPLDASSGAYTQDQINEILSDLPKAPQALPPSPEMVQFEENVATDPKGGDKSLEGGAEAIEGLMNKSIMDYIDNIRGTSPEQAQKVKTLAKYKEEFAEATGLDVSGKPDTKDALVAFGLALMQNKAGKGFNVGNILKATGEAGEKAMPLLQKAKADAKAVALSAGKYALEMRASDTAKAEAAKEKAMNRQKYWVYKKGPSGAEFAGFEDGEFVDLNPFELDKLMKDKSFERNYEYINGSDYLEIQKERAKGMDFGDAYGKGDHFSLLGGAVTDSPKELIVFAAPRDSNYKGPEVERFKLIESPESIARRFFNLQKSINSGSQKMKVLLEKLGKGVTIPKQFLSSANEILVGFGIAETSDITEAKRLLKNIAIDEATAILKESGKTLSDNDRKLVERRVGNISWGSADVEEIKRQLKDIYSLTVLKPQENLDTAMDWLKTNAGINFSEVESDQYVDKPKNQSELDALNEMAGTEFTMDDFK